MYIHKWALVARDQQKAKQSISGFEGSRTCFNLHTAPTARLWTGRQAVRSVRHPASLLDKKRGAEYSAPFHHSATDHRHHGSHSARFDGAGRRDRHRRGDQLGPGLHPGAGGLRQGHCGRRRRKDRHAQEHQGAQELPQGRRAPHHPARQDVRLHGLAGPRHQRRLLLQEVRPGLPVLAGPVRHLRRPGDDQRDLRRGRPRAPQRGLLQDHHGRERQGRAPRQGPQDQEGAAGHHQGHQHRGHKPRRHLGRRRAHLQRRGPSVDPQRHLQEHRAPVPGVVPDQQHGGHRVLLHLRRPHHQLGVLRRQALLGVAVLGHRRPDHPHQQQDRQHERPPAARRWLLGLQELHPHRGQPLRRQLRRGPGALGRRAAARGGQPLLRHEQPGQQPRHQRQRVPGEHGDAGGALRGRVRRGLPPQRVPRHPARAALQRPRAGGGPGHGPVPRGHQRRPPRRVHARARPGRAGGQLAGLAAPRPLSKSSRFLVPYLRVRTAGGCGTLRLIGETTQLAPRTLSLPRPLHSTPINRFLFSMM